MEWSTPEENPAEPVPDVAGAAEPAQPAEPEEISAELETEIHENVNQDIEGTSSTTDEINGVENVSTDESKSIEEELQLRKKPLASSKTDMEDKHRDGEGTSSNTDDINEGDNLSTDESKSLEEKLQLRKKPLISSKTDMEDKQKDSEGAIKKSSSKEFRNKHSQTFFKYMKNVTDLRCVQIMNQEVNHEDSDLIFYRSSKELLSSIDFLESNID